ncbi:MAG: hypothetical protein V7641_2163 [Blastocatellia bacterium]
MKTRNPGAVQLARTHCQIPRMNMMIDPFCISRCQRTRLLAALLAALLLTPTVHGLQSAGAASAVAPLSAAEREAAERITADQIRETTAALTAADMQGRGTAQPGGDKAARYLAERFSKLGLKPLGDNGTYLQAVKFKVYQPQPPMAMQVDGEALKFGDDFVISPPYNGDHNVSGNLMFLSYGLRQDFNLLNLQGKIAVLINGPPKGVDEAWWKKQDAQRLIISRIFQLGAAAIIITNGGTKENPYATIARYMTRRYVAPEDRPEMPSTFPPFVLVSDAAAEQLFKGSGTTYAQAKAKADQGQMAAQALKSTVKLAVRVKKEKGAGSNVIGLLEGADAKLKEEAIVYTAHYDAFGVEADGRIYPGAADNALGVAQMLAVAEAFTRLRPRRSVIFMAVTGEEYGLLGTEYWTKHPTWKLQKIAADLNFDGLGTEVYGPVKRIVGFGAEHSELGALLGQVAAATGNLVVPDPMPDEKSFYRSDHYAFVKRGVPALMLMGLPEMDKAALVARIKQWEQTDYHQPTDTIRPEWHWDGPRAIAAVGLLVGMRLAETDALPAWLPSSPFNQPRGTNKEPPPEQ